VTCTCCVCAGLPLTRGFGGPAWLPAGSSDQNLDFTTTKLVTWADAGGSIHNVVDGHGPIEMQGQPGWDSFVDGRWLSGSSVTFTKLDGPGLSLGTFLFPSVWTIDYPDNETLSALPKSGSVTASLYGVSLALSYSLTLNQLDASVSNAVYVDKSDDGDPPFTASAVIGQQIQSRTFAQDGDLPSVLDLSSTVVSSAGTSLDEFTERPLDGLKDLLCWREVFPGTDQAKWNLQQQQLGGADQTPPITSGYTLSHTLEFNSEQRLLLPEGGEPRPSWPYPASLTFVCDGQPTDEQLPTSGFWTAAVFRPTHLTWAPQTQIDYEVTGPTGTVSPYIKGNLVGIDRGNTADQNTGTGMLYRITKDGSETLPSTQAPTRQQLFDATEDEGAYLVTVTPTGSYGYPSTAIPANKDFFSFVIDRKKPVVGFTPLDDIFVIAGDPEEARPVSIALTSTKPLVNPACADDESPTGVLARPCRNIWLEHEGQSVEALSDLESPAWTAGTYTLSLPFDVSECIDNARNNPDELFTQSWTVHEKDANYRRAVLPGGHSYYGAIPSLEQPGLQTREYYRARLQPEKVGSLMLTFDRPVDPATVENSQVRLYCNGVLTAGCTIEQADATTMKWRIIVPPEVQQSATFCLLEYDPAGTVMTADVFSEVHYPTKDDFPTDPQRYSELFRLVFIADDDSARYSVAVNPATYAISYVAIGDGNPLDWNGNAYDPEPSVIVARTSWLMADTAGWPRLIDTSSVLRGFVVGRAASIGASTSIDTTQNNLTITSTGDIGIAAESSPGPYSSLGLIVQPPVQPQQDFMDFGLVATAVNYEGFVPRAPVTGATGPFSYWGLGTTIDPSPPAIVTQCAGPSEQQWHSSAITCDTEITEFEARIVLLDESGAEIDPSETDGGYVENKVVFNGAAIGDFNHVAADLFPRIMCLDSPPEIKPGTTFQGTTLSQNVWACVVAGGGTEITAQPQATRNAYFLDGEAFTESAYWLDESPHFLLHFDSAEREFGNSETPVEEAKNGLRFTENDLSTAGPFPFGETELQRRIRSVKSATYSIEGVQGVLSACRQAKIFPALKTTTLGPLVLTLSLRACIKAETEYEDFSLKPTEHVRIVGDPTGWGGPVYIYQEDVTFSEAMDWLLDNLSGLDAVANKWKLPVARWLMYCEKDESLATRTLTERVLNDYVYTHTLTPDQEVSLANGEEITMPLGGASGYSVKLKRS
jgi:hypothetical protein